jgi:hypothetical protein
VEDLWSLEPEALSELTDSKSFIFVVKYVGGIEESSKAGKSVRCSSARVSFLVTGRDSSMCREEETGTMIC